MHRLQAYKYALIPNAEQEHAMRSLAGSHRFVFHKALSLQKENHEAGNKFIGYVTMAKQLTAWRNEEETPCLKEASCHPLQQILKDLELDFGQFCIANGLT